MSLTTTEDEAKDLMVVIGCAEMIAIPECILLTRMLLDYFAFTIAEKAANYLIQELIHRQ